MQLERRPVSCNTASASTAIVLACDDRYAPHAAVVLQSLLVATPHRDFQLVLLSSLSLSWQTRLQQLVSRHGATLQLVPIEHLLQRPPLQQLAATAGSNSVPHASASALARLLACSPASCCRRIASAPSTSTAT